MSRRRLVVDNGPVARTPVVGTWRLVAALALTAVVVVVGAGPAGAHASFVAATPSPGSGLPQAPGAVAMRFSEPLNRRLSKIEILDRQGRDVGVGPTAAVARDPLAMRRRLGLLPPGQYTVRWLTVSTLDGHTLQGSYSFAIGAAADAAEHVQASPIDSEGRLGLAGRWVALVGLSLWAGTVLLAGVAARGGVALSHLRHLGRAAPGLALAGTAASVVSISLVTTGSVGHVGEVLGGSESGQWRAIELAVITAGVLVPPLWRGVQAPFLAMALLSEAGAGHAAASPAPGVAIVSFAAHLSAVGTWVYALVAAVLAPSARRLLGVVWPWAVVAAAVVALTGTLNAALELSRVGDLTSTSYGQVLLVKIVALVLMAGLGLTHSLLRRRPAASETTIRRPVGAECLSPP